MLVPHLNTLPGSIRFGRFVLPVFGIFATAGLLAAMFLSQRTAPKAGISKEKLWDLGLLAVVLAYVVSRAMLIAANWQAFLAFPMLVLTLPSLTGFGVLLAAVLLLVWLRWKGLSALAVADAWAPCATLLAVFLQLGHFIEGTDAGMPTAMPWGIHAPGDTVLGRTEPVQLFAAAAAGVLTWFLIRRLNRPHRRGHIAALALVLGGVLSFALDMLRQPEMAESALPLDVSQVFAAIGVISGVVLWLALSEPHIHVEITPLL